MTTLPRNDNDRVPPPRIFLLLENPSKSNNLGPILRCASAFGITTVVLIGYATCSVEGSHGAAKHVQIVAFPAFDDAAVTNYLHQELHCHTIVGIMGCLAEGYDAEYGHDIYETADGSNTTFVRPTTTTTSSCGSRDASTNRTTHTHSCGQSYPVQSFPFSQCVGNNNNNKMNTGGGGDANNICFVVSKQKQGLPMPLFRACDAYVHVPFSSRRVQKGNNNDDDESSHNNILLLDSPACLSIVLHELTTQMQMVYCEERTFQQHKFHVETRNRHCNKQYSESRKAKRAEEKQIQAETEHLIMDEGAMSSLFSTDKLF